MDKNFTIVQTFTPDAGETETYACSARGTGIWLCYDVDGGTSILKKVDPDSGAAIGDPITTEVRIGNAPFTGGFCLHDIGCGELLTIERESGQVIAIKVQTITSSLDPTDPDAEVPPDPTLGTVVRRYNLTLPRLDARVNGDGTRMVYVAGTALALYDLVEDAAIRTIHNFGVDIGYPCWLADGSFLVNTNAPSGGWYANYGPLLRVDLNGKPIKSCPLPDTIESDFLYGVQAMLDASDCLQKLNDDASETTGNVSGVGLAWVAYSDDSGDGNDHYTVVVVRLESGEIVSSSQLEEFDEVTDDWGVFILIGSGGFGSGTGDANQDNTLPPKPATNCLPGTVSTTSPNPGCNPGGQGWTPSYTGPSGVVPTASDPDPGETLTGKRTVFVDVEIRHTKTNGDADTLRYALVDLDDEQRKEGRIQSIGDVEQALSDPQGNMESASVNIAIMDAQGRPLGTRFADDDRKYFSRDEVLVRARSAEGRIPQGSPLAPATPRMIGRGLLYGESYGTPITAELTAVDPLFVDGGSFGPDKKFPQFNFPTSIYTEAPPDIARLFMPIIFGDGQQTSDEGAVDPATGLSSSRGRCPLRFVGMDEIGWSAPGSATGRFNICLFASYKVLGAYGSDLGGMGLYGMNAVANVTTNKKTGKTTTIVALDGSPDLTLVSTNGYHDLVLWTENGRSEHRVIGKGAGYVKVDGTVDPDVVNGVDWYIAPISYLPRRVKIDLATRNGVDVSFPTWPGHVKATPYEDILNPDFDGRVTDAWVRGPLLRAHLAGEVTLACNMIGIEDQGDGSGLPITDYFTAYCFFWDNCVHRQLARPAINVAGTLKWPQTNGHVPQYDDGLSKTKQSSFAAAQAQTAMSLGGDGLKISAYFADGISIRDAVQLWNDNGGCRTYIDEYGRVGVWLLDRYADTSTWPRIDHVSRVFGDVRRTRALDELENVVVGGCDWDPEEQKFREENMRATDPAAVARNKGIKKQSKHLDGKLLAFKSHFQNVLDRRLAVQKDGPVYVSIENGDIGLLDFPIGSGIRFTSVMGPGANGYVDQPLIILRRTFHVDSHLVSLLCLEVSNLIIPAGQQFIATDDDDLAPVDSDDDAVAPVAA